MKTVIDVVRVLYRNRKAEIALVTSLVALAREIARQLGH